MALRAQESSAPAHPRAWKHAPFPGGLASQGFVPEAAQGRREGLLRTLGAQCPASHAAPRPRLIVLLLPLNKEDEEAFLCVQN